MPQHVQQQQIPAEVLERLRRQQAADMAVEVFPFVSRTFWWDDDQHPADRGFNSEEQMHKWAEKRSTELAGFVEVHGGMSDGGHYKNGEFTKAAA